MSSVPLNVTGQVTVTYEQCEYEVTRGTRVKAFLRRFAPDVEETALGAILGNRLKDLESPISASCTLKPVTYASFEGRRIYRATLAVMLCEAVRRRFPEVSVQVGQSFGQNYFFELWREVATDQPALSADDVAEVEAEMRQMVARREALAVVRLPRDGAIEILNSAQMAGTAELVASLRRSWVQLVTMGGAPELWFHPLLPTTEKIRNFKVIPYQDGVVLILPPLGDSSAEPEPLGAPISLFAAYRETRDWNERVGVATVADLNRHVIKGSIGEVVRVAEALHERKIAALADAVVASPGCRLVMVAGPSSSGKTTFVKRLSMQLLALGKRPKALSVDNYYVNREETPLDSDGAYDFECIEAIDLDLLNEHLLALLGGQEVATPRYSFTEGKRIPGAIPMTLGNGEILLIEGIHGLNGRLTAAIEADRKFGIYVSALTQLVIDNHNRIFTSDARLIRRIVRDRRYRGYSAEETLMMWPKVRAGEEKWIFPFQEGADAMFNSTLVYEPAVLKLFAERFLMEVPSGSPAHVEAVRLLRFLDLFVPLFPDDVPGTSILREFLGDSVFKY